MKRLEIGNLEYIRNNHDKINNINTYSLGDDCEMCYLEFSMYRLTKS